MKIGFDSKRLFCNFTGLGNYSRTLVGNLAQNYPQHDYFLYTTEIKKTPETQPFLDKKNGFHTHLSTALFKAYWRSFSIIKQLQKDNIEIYHGLSNELPFGIHKTDIKTVVTIHDLIFKIYPQTYSFIDRTIYDWKFRYSCEHADKILANSNSTKNDIIHYYNINPDKIEVVYHPCQPLYYNSKIIDNKVLEQYKIPKQYVLYVGTVQERKNLKLLIKAYQHLSPELRLPIVIVGRGGQYLQEVKQLITESNLQHLVFWIEKLDDNAVLQTLYQAASVLVYPSFCEGLGLPVIEALLSKTPVITALTSSLPEAGGPHSLYINPLDDKDLALALEKVLTDKTLSQQMIERGFVYAHERFNAEKLSVQVMSSYEKLLR